MNVKNNKRRRESQEKIVKAFRKYVGNKKDKSGMYGGKNGFVLICFYHSIYSFLYIFCLYSFRIFKTRR